MRVEHWFYTVPLRLRSLFRRAQVERELDEELQYHLERQIEEYVARGMEPDAARTEALRALGGIARRKDEMRDTRGLNWLDDFRRDARYAARMLRRSPTFAAVAALTLALGIGSSAAIFSVVDAVLLRPLPYRDADRLVFLQQAGGTVAAATYFDWKAASRTAARMSAAESWTPNLTGGDKPEEVGAIRLTADHLPMLGVSPLLGRFFLPEEGHAGPHRVIVLGHGIWQRRFAGDTSVIGRSIPVDGEPYTIVGVMPPGFQFVPLWAEEAELATPLVLDDRRTDRQGSSLRVFARLRPGITLADTRDDLAAVGARLAREHPGTDQRVMVTPLQDAVVGSVRTALLILLAAVGCVLLIACANVAHLQLMRAAVREREFAVRAALGASRRRLVQQSLVESAMLSVVGGLLGIAVAFAGVRLLIALAPAGRLPRLAAVAIDGRVVLFALAASALAAVVFGLGPALAASSRLDTHDTLRDGARGSGDSGRRGRARATLVVSELAMALVLLAAAGLVVRSFQSMRAVDPGYDVRNVVSMTVSLKGTKQAKPVERRAAFFDDLTRQVRALPGVEYASAINHLPMFGDHWRFPFTVEGEPKARPDEPALASFRIVRPGYFRTMRIPIVAGRDFSASDEAQRTHVVIVNESMARRRWPSANPIGRRITVDDPANGPDWFSVIGVVKEVRQGSLTEESQEEMYFPYLPSPKEGTLPLRLANFLSPVYMTLVIRTASDAAATVRAVESIVRSMERDAPLSNVTTMEQVVRGEFAQPRFYLLLFGAFATVALTLAVVGVYGVISYSVARRTREIGLRVALGAPPSGPFRLVVGQGMQLALFGIGIGLTLAILVTRYLRAVLFGVEPTDPLTLGSAVVVLAVTALAACCVPAWRASKVDPMVALRAE